MTTRISRARVIAPAVAASLAAASLIALSAVPASAATSTFTQDTDISMGGVSYDVSNTASISIPAVGTAGTYPSTINVTSPTLIKDVNVHLFNISHTFPDDLDILLVGPGGEQVILMSDAGDGADAGEDLVNANLTFDSQAGSLLPDSTAIGASGGTFRPTNYEGVDSWQAPAPVANGNTSLSVFNDTLAAGTWSLYIRDDTVVDSGTVAGGWGLSFVTETVPHPSTVAVTGLPQISDVNVHLNGITANEPDDINLLLVGPGGQQSYLWGDSGGFLPISNFNVTFDDEAAGTMPDDDPITNGGTYKPFLQGDIEDFGSPAPPATGVTVLSVFDGQSPNGNWDLYAFNDAMEEPIVISGWSLEFTWADTLNPTGTVTVNGGAATTNTTAVTLGVTANDPAPASGVTQMRFSNDGVTFSPYQAFAPTAAWTLAAGDGVKTVYAQFRDADGNQSAVATDTIALSTVVPDTTSPTVVKTTPAKNAKGVKVTTKVKLKVSEALNASTITTKTVYLKAKGSSKKVKAKLKYNAAGKTIVLTPKSALKHNKKYTFTATPGVKDVSGNPLDGAAGKPGAQKVTFSFTTG
ncbi:Ig-like domain-containing protein [Nocardioides islandensis]|jgi:subtilisin-like proprotein convertase family protein|uniref:Ig-like domain-containing protein n=1 Tax=Nocardioides islandensis TaxID=433663 RepID=A0A930VAP5_9ACTN|nr:Ig-like domain-containing protein [Nocardioides islandensis]MBF4762993.1 Ig-like domain-containing protein [Nocardioides islandensis]